MKPSTLAIIVLLPTIGIAQGTPDTGNSKLWEMRKKVQQRNAQRAGSYLEQMNQSLTDGDSAGAESALKSAIAQGTLTQPQIDDARGRIEAVVSAQQQAMVAAARAKEATEARMTQSQNRSVPTAPASNGGGGAQVARSLSITFRGNGMQSIRVFNLNEGGGEARSSTARSPAGCSFASASEARDDWASYYTLNLMNEGKGFAGTYGYEVTFIEVLDRNLITPNKVGHRQTFKGTFQIPAGKTHGSVVFEKFRWGDSKIEVSPYFYP